jgi:hypothetical protein
LLSYGSYSCAYRVFNKDSGYIENTFDVMFDKTNGFQVEQYNLSVVDDDEAPCDTLQIMVIGDVRPQDPSEHQSRIPNDTTPPIQDHEQDKEDKHEDE